jgi:hypothetical protein
MIHINVESATPDTLIKELEALGFTIIMSRPAPSWNGREPETLVIASIDVMPPVSRLRRIAANHNQDCLAVRFGLGDGITIGSQPVAYSEEHFNVA